MIKNYNFKVKYLIMALDMSGYTIVPEWWVYLVEFLPFVNIYYYIYVAIRVFMYTPVADLSEQKRYCVYLWM